MEGVERGDVKYLRVLEATPKLAWTYNGWNGQGIRRAGDGVARFLRQEDPGHGPGRR